MRYFAGGVEVSEAKKDEILRRSCGRLIRCPDGQPMVAPAVLSDRVAEKNGRLDESDPLLQEALAVVGLPIEKTFIVLVDKEPCDPLDDFKRTFLYGYW